MARYIAIGHVSRRPTCMYTPESQGNGCPHQRTQVILDNLLLTHHPWSVTSRAEKVIFANRLEAVKFKASTTERTSVKPTSHQCPEITAGAAVGAARPAGYCGA
jgi:hypothetical protein